MPFRPDHRSSTRGEPRECDVLSADLISPNELLSGFQILGLPVWIDIGEWRLDSAAIFSFQALGQQHRMGAALLHRPQGLEIEAVGLAVVEIHQVVGHTLIALDALSAITCAWVNKVGNVENAFRIQVLARIQLAVAIDIFIAVIEEDVVGIKAGIEAKVAASSKRTPSRASASGTLLPFL